MATESSKKPLMALGKIPSVDILKEHLGLNTAPVNVKNTFRDITVQWRKTNIGSNSQPATDLTDWNSPAVQRDLYTLAENFLADKDNAEHFWSASRPWKYDSTLQYPEDKERIIELLVQLFFKQNKTFQANSKYALWANKDSESKSSSEGSTPQQKASMDTASDHGTDKSSRKRPRSETVDNQFSPTSNFIDLSGSFDSSPLLPWDHTLPTPRDIYDMPEEEELMNGHRSESHGSTLPSRPSEVEHMGDSGPAKRKAPYSFRERRQNRFRDGPSETEFEDMIRASSDSDSSESPPRAPVAHMMNDMDLQSTDHRHIESSTPSQTRSESTVPKANAGSGSPQMPPPPRASKKTPSPKQKNPKSHKVIPKTSKGGMISSRSSASKQSKTSPTTKYKQPSVEDVTESTASATSPSLQPGFTPGSLPEGGYPTDSLLGATAAAKKPTPSSSQATPTPSQGQRKVQKSSPKSKNTTSAEFSQASASQHAGTGNNLPATSPATNLTATSSSSKTQANSSSTNNPSKQHPKPQTHINFFIITTEDDSSIVWPEGKIQGTSLSEFIAGVAKATQRDGIERLELTLKTSTSKTMAPVAKDDEAAWLLAKKHFGERLMAARAKAKAKGLDESANPEIYVEPFYGVVNALGEGELENEEEVDVRFLFD